MSKKYTPTEWVANKTVATADVMNNIEQGIVDAHQDIGILDSQIKEKANKNEIVIKGQGTLSDFDEDTRLAIQGLGSTNINAVLGFENVDYENIKKNAVYIDNLGFIKKSQNADIYYTKEIVNGYILNNTNGKLVENTNYCTTGYINVDYDSTYFTGFKNNNTPLNIQRVCFYDKDKTFLSYDGNKNNFITPSSCKYVRLSFSSTYYSNVDNIKIQLDSLTPIEPHVCKEDIKLERYETLKPNSVDNENIKDKTVTVNKIQFIDEPTNKDYFYPRNLITGKALNIYGTLVDNANACTSDFIFVNPDTLYCLGLSDNTALNIQTYAFYDIDKNFISYNGNTKTFTTPSNCAYIRMTLAIVWADSLNDIKLQENSLSLLQPYECNIDLKIERYEPSKPIDYIDTEIKDTIKKILDNTEEQSVSFAFITDLHCDDIQETSKASLRRQLNAIVEIANNSPLDFVCLGGDLYSGNYFKDDKQDAKNLILELIEPLKQCKKPVYVLKGNHDDSSYHVITYKTTIDENKILNSNEYYTHTNGMLEGRKNSKNNYFYFDIEEKNTRVICLNASDYPLTKNEDGSRKYAGCNYFGYSINQLKWLVNTALSSPNKKYILLSHIGNDIFTVYNRDILNNIISALNSKSEFQGLDITKDFSGYKGLELYCFGHLHADRLEKTSSIANTITVSVGSGIIDNTEINSEEEKNRYSRVLGRKFGDITEALFDIVINKENEVKCIRFGAGEDRSITK